ncbi:MAG: arginase family protein [Rhodobacterales bacterium]|nr:arginase family protein [Rhodobacterales bacterium]
MPLAAPLRPFLDWTVATDPNHWEPVDVALIGIPYSEHYSGEPRPNDQAAGPEAIRALSGQLTYGAEFFDFNFDATLDAVLPKGGRDGGNLISEDGDFGKGFAEAVRVMEHQFATARFSVMLGGDHGVTIPALHGLKALDRPVHLVQIDAHIDWRDEVRGAKLGYSSPIRRASELPWIKGITQIGIRGSGSARAQEVADARAWGAKLVTADTVHADLSAVLSGLQGQGPFYLTIDLDGLDPSVAPGVAGPAPGGLRVEQVRPILAALAREGLVGMDVVELAPSVDSANGITAITAGRLVLDALAYSRGVGL